MLILLFSLPALCLCTHMHGAIFHTKKDPFLKRDNMFLVRSFFKDNFELIVLDLGLCGYIF